MLYEKIAMTIAVCAVAATLAHAQHREWTAEAREAVHHVFTGDSTLDIDNINGSNEVIGDNESSIRVEGERIIRAEDQVAIDRAKREVTLDMNERDGVAQLYVNGPFRGNGHSSADHGFHDHDGDRHYEVTYNLTVHVPRRIALELRSVNGPIDTSNTEGKFEINAVNGHVTARSIAGSGSLRSVNGPISAAFSQSPTAPITFKTVNGKIEATFPPNLAADLNLKTLNGGMFTDFDMTALANAPGAPQSKNGRVVYRSNREAHLRAGAGGPALSFETVNGQISIHKGDAR